jgi:hypothetical protein
VLRPGEPAVEAQAQLTAVLMVRLSFDNEIRKGYKYEDISSTSCLPGIWASQHPCAMVTGLVFGEFITISRCED